MKTFIVSILLFFVHLRQYLHRITFKKVQLSLKIPQILHQKEVNQ